MAGNVKGGLENVKNDWNSMLQVRQGLPGSQDRRQSD
jgi:hypothetical protein